MMTDTNSPDSQNLLPSAQKALRQRVIKAYKKGIKRTQIAKTFGMCFKLPKWNVFPPSGFIPRKVLASKLGGCLNQRSP